MGIQPDFLHVGVMEELIRIKSKLSLHYDKLQRIFSLETFDTIYAVPITLLGGSRKWETKISEFLNLKNKRFRSNMEENGLGITR